MRGKTSARDLVTDADEAAERMISARLAKLYPGAVLIGEEASTRNPALLNMLVDADLAFLIDPIDGTRNYVAGLPLFGMMIAACHRGDVIAGVIYDPVSRDSADRARRRRMDGIRERQAGAAGRGQSRAARDMDGLISTGALPEPLRSTVNGNLSKLGSTASLRCAAHEYRMLAAGHCHVALYNQLTAWDHAAGWLLHREAGGYAARFDGSPYHTPTAAACCTRPTRAAGMPRKSADGRGFRGLGKLSGRVRPRPESHFPGLRLGLSLGVIPTICGQPYGKLCNSRKTLAGQGLV